MLHKEPMQFQVAEEFSPYPFGRDASDGRGNGEAFRRLLAKRFAEAQSEQKRLEVILDNVHGLGGAFMRSGFGEFAQEMKKNGASLSEENFRLKGNEPMYEVYIRKIREMMDEYDSNGNLENGVNGKR